MVAVERGGNNFRTMAEEQENIEEERPVLSPISEAVKRGNEIIPASIKALKDDKMPLYLPQREDYLPLKLDEKVGPVGPWATGHVSYSPTAGLTGLRPVADRYFITQGATAQWRKHNKIYLDQSEEKINEARNLALEVKECRNQIYKETDKNQLENGDRLSTRAGVVHQLKSELEQTIFDITKEIELLDGERRRVRRSLSVLTLPTSIAGEFLHIRNTRYEPDLVRDEVEDELVKEVALCAEIKNTFAHCREQIEGLMNEMKVTKNRLEFDWTDKEDAYEIESTNMGLKNNSHLAIWRPGATRGPSEQSTPSVYVNFTQSNLNDAETLRRQSEELRNDVNLIITKNIRDLRTQANLVDNALSKKIELTEQARQCLEKELSRCLNQLSSTDSLVEELRRSTRGLQNATKVAQTRLYNRLDRPNIENCRDEPQSGLTEEVRILGENISALNARLKQAEEVQIGLIKARTDLEREIAVKKASLYIDRDRGQKLRLSYPSSTALSGYEDFE